MKTTSANYKTKILFGSFSARINKRADFIQNPTKLLIKNNTLQVTQLSHVRVKHKQFSNM